MWLLDCLKLYISHISIRHHCYRIPIRNLKLYFHVILAAKMLILMHGHYNLDYKKTSLGPYVKIFEKFLENLDKSRKGELLKKSGKTMLSPVSYLDLSIV